MCECACTYVGAVEGGTRQTRSTGQCMLYVRSHMGLAFVCECAHIRVFERTHMFQLTAGAETDNQEGREPECANNSVVERSLSQRFAEMT